MVNSSIEQLGKFNSSNPPTYRQLKKHLELLSNEQLDMVVTVELNVSEEFLPGYLDIISPNHVALDVVGEDQPVIRIDY